MADSDRRKQLEANLRDAIEQGEKVAFRAPEVKEMVESLRSLYKDDKRVLFSALGLRSAEKPPDPSLRLQLPESRIPDLIHVLDALAKRRKTKTKSKLISSSNPSSTQKSTTSALPKPEAAPSNRTEYNLNPTGSIDSSSTPDFKIHPVTGELTGRKAIQSIDEEIRQAKAMLDLVSRDRDAIRSRLGSYAIPINRLKAERLLRELPGRIAYLNEKKAQIESNNE